MSYTIRVKVKNKRSVLITQNLVLSGVALFTDLTDTFADYTGKAGKAIAVKADGTGLEAVNAGISCAVPDPNATVTVRLFQFPFAATITKIWGTVYEGTSLTFNIEERAATALNVAGTDIMTADLVAVQAGASSVTFSNPGIAANAFLVLSASAMVGTVKDLVIEIDYVRA